MDVRWEGEEAALVGAEPDEEEEVLERELLVGEEGLEVFKAGEVAKDGRKKGA